MLNNILCEKNRKLEMHNLKSIQVFFNLAVASQVEVLLCTTSVSDMPRAFLCVFFIFSYFVCSTGNRTALRTICQDDFHGTERCLVRIWKPRTKAPLLNKHWEETLARRRTPPLITSSISRDRKPPSPVDGLQHHHTPSRPDGLNDARTRSTEHQVDPQNSGSQTSCVTELTTSCSSNLIVSTRCNSVLPCWVSSALNQPINQSWSHWGAWSNRGRTLKIREKLIREWSEWVGLFFFFCFPDVSKRGIEATKSLKGTKGIYQPSNHPHQTFCWGRTCHWIPAHLCHIKRCQF